jgi:hypothetical protein
MNVLLVFQQKLGELVRFGTLGCQQNPDQLPGVLRDGVGFTGFKLITAAQRHHLADGQSMLDDLLNHIGMVFHRQPNHRAQQAFIKLMVIGQFERFI